MDIIVSVLTGGLGGRSGAQMLDVEGGGVLGIERSCEGEMLYLCPDSRPVYFSDMYAMRVALPANRYDVV